MISLDHARLMARYNEWQNRSLYGAADTLDDAARRLDRGAFFRSIQDTLNHLQWGDQIWMSRFAGWPKPESGGKRSLTRTEDWEELKAARVALDQRLTDWVASLDDAWLRSDLTWVSIAAGKELTRPRWILLAHMFNHQTHHRGQVHAMLTAAGAKPDDTDLMLLAD